MVFKIVTAALGTSVGYFLPWVILPDIMFGVSGSVLANAILLSATIAWGVTGYQVGRFVMWREQRSWDPPFRLRLLGKDGD